MTLDPLIGCIISDGYTVDFLELAELYVVYSILRRL